MHTEFNVEIHRQLKELRQEYQIIIAHQTQSLFRLSAASIPFSNSKKCFTLLSCDCVALVFYSIPPMLIQAKLTRNKALTIQSSLTIWFRRRNNTSIESTSIVSVQVWGTSSTIDAAGGLLSKWFTSNVCEARSMKLKDWTEQNK